MGPDRNTNLRNIAIVLLLAVAVWQLPGGGTATNTISNVLGLIFAGGLVFLGYRMYMEHRTTLFILEDKVRALLYGSLVMARCGADRHPPLLRRGRPGRPRLARADRRRGVRLRHGVPRRARVLTLPRAFRHHRA